MRIIMQEEKIFPENNWLCPASDISSVRNEDGQIKDTASSGSATCPENKMLHWWDTDWKLNVANNKDRLQHNQNMFSFCTVVVLAHG